MRLRSAPRFITSASGADSPLEQRPNDMHVTFKWPGQMSFPQGTQHCARVSAHCAQRALSSHAQPRPVALQMPGIAVRFAAQVNPDPEGMQLPLHRSLAHTSSRVPTAHGFGRGVGPGVGLGVGLKVCACAVSALRAACARSPDWQWDWASD